MGAYIHGLLIFYGACYPDFTVAVVIQAQIVPHWLLSLYSYGWLGIQCAFTTAIISEYASSVDICGGVKFRMNLHVKGPLTVSSTAHFRSASVMQFATK